MEAPPPEQMEPPLKPKPKPKSKSKQKKQKKVQVEMLKITAIDPNSQGMNQPPPMMSPPMMGPPPGFMGPPPPGYGPPPHFTGPPMSLPPLGPIPRWNQQGIFKKFIK